VVYVTAANVQDRDAAFFLLQRLRLLHREITLVWADSGYDYHRLINGAATARRLVVQIVRWPDDVTGFTVLPRRWTVERTLSWICQRRRCVRDYERLPENHEAMVTISMIMLMSRCLARPLPHNLTISRTSTKAAGSMTIAGAAEESGYYRLNTHTPAFKGK
jgi:transposase